MYSKAYKDTEGKKIRLGASFKSKLLLQTYFCNFMGASQPFLAIYIWGRQHEKNKTFFSYFLFVSSTLRGDDEDDAEGTGEAATPLSRFSPAAAAKGGDETLRTDEEGAVGALTTCSRSSMPQKGGKYVSINFVSV